MTSKTDKQNSINECMASDKLMIRRYIGLDKSKISRQSAFSRQDWQMLFDLQDHPPEPTERMKKALQTYNKIIDSDKLGKG